MTVPVPLFIVQHLLTKIKEFHIYNIKKSKLKKLQLKLCLKMTVKYRILLEIPRNVAEIALN